VYACIQAFARGGRVLDLGCGSGTTAIELERGSCRDYTGVDISEFAIEKALRRARRQGLGATTRFVFIHGDIFSFEPQGLFDVILFRDSIYYVPHGNIAGMLERYAQHLRPSGAIVVRMANGHEKYRAIVDTIERRFDVVDKRVSENPSAVVMVFRSRRGAISG
jgi:SAM-dependent methyltransferase